MDFTAATKTSVLLALICVCGLKPQPMIADEAPRAVSENPDEPSDALRDLARLTWAMLDAIEREHISAPVRSELLGIVARVLTGLDDGPALDAALVQFAGCQNANELGELLDRRGLPSIPFDQLPNEITKGLEKKLGGLRLIRTKDLVVEEQFRGNRYVGLGVRLAIDHNSRLLQLGDIIPGGPAERGGLTPGTSIHQIDGRSTQDVPVETLLDWLRGPRGTEVTLKVTPTNVADERTVTLARGVVRFDSVFDQDHTSLNRGKLRLKTNEPIGWIKVQDITGSTLHELRVAEVKARVEGIRVMVLDFRAFGRSDNFHQAQLVADSLLDGGTIWEIAGRGGEPRQEIADRECLFRGVPLVILVDQNCGAAHCAIAAALQDADRATIVGIAPGFVGMIATTIPLSGVPFALMMNTTQLTRARRDRDWPLKPDHPIMEKNATIVAYPPNAILSQSAALLKRMTLPPHVRYAPRVAVMSEAPASALSTANVKQEIRINDFPKLVRDQKVVRVKPVPLVPIPSADEIALQVAKELLTALPPE